MIGVSTHSLEQVRAAILDGADYIGVGPTFPSRTKNFDQFPGLDFVSAVATETSLPAFALGGITLETVAQVVAAGARRVAVSSAIAEAAGPARDGDAVPTNPGRPVPRDRNGEACDPDLEAFRLQVHSISQ